ncbi:hypothetical protein ACHAW6_015035 [Cyclotella cf. meneghiniana]
MALNGNLQNSPHHVIS